MIWIEKIRYHNKDNNSLWKMRIQLAIKFLQNILDINKFSYFSFSYVLNFLYYA